MFRWTNDDEDDDGVGQDQNVIVDNGGENRGSGSEIDLSNQKVDGEGLPISSDFEDESPTARLFKGMNGNIYKTLANGEIQLALFQVLRM